MRRFLFVTLVAGLSFIDSEPAVAQVNPPPGYTLERAVLIMRHGVRPPTKSAQSMAALSDQPWPDDAAWGVAPGELTRRGSVSIQKMGADLRRVYVDAGLLPATGTLADLSLIWADGADQRTRATAQFLALGLAADGAQPIPQPIPVSWSKADVDPLFDGLNSGVCHVNVDALRESVLAQGPLDTAQTSAALATMQTILAPLACEHGAGSCLAGPSKLTATSADVKITGPLAIGASVAESLLLEYENNLPMAQVGWGRASRADIAQLMSLHEHTSDLTRKNPYMATRRAYALTEFILKALSDKSVGSTTPAISAAQRLIVLTGHDTNLSNLAGVFGLDWSLPGQPDSTAPGTTIAFERWRENGSGKVILKMRLFYQGMDQVRDLAILPVQQISLMPAACRSEGQGCEMGSFVTKVSASLPNDCKL